MKTKIAISGFLNSLPLRYGLEKEPEVELITVSPSEAATGLSEGIYDIGFIPLAAYAEDGRLEALEGPCVSSRGSVASVVLVSHFPPQFWQKLLLDSASRSSALLADMYFHYSPYTKPQKKRVATCKIQEELNKTPHGAALLIGDIALQEKHSYPYVIDLGEFYEDKFERPFVYALWAALPGEFTSKLQEILRRCFRRGLAAREEIAKKWALENDYSDLSTCLDYLQHNIHYTFDEEVRESANQYLALLHVLGKAPATEVSFCPLSPKKEILSLGKPSRTIDSILSDGAQGVRLSAKDGIRLFKEAPLAELGRAAHARRLSLSDPKIVTYIIERNINYTNVCNIYCRFCAFYRRPGHKEGYTLSKSEIAEKTQVLAAAGGTQVLLQGGLNPDLDINWYEDLFLWFEQTFPQIRLHALSPDEIWHLTSMHNLSTTEVLERLRFAGLQSIPGAGAEILVDAVRWRIARLKTKSEEWLDIMRQAHWLGIRSSVTMMFGVKEFFSDRIQHLIKVRNLQDETGGFTAFICWPYQQGNLKLEKGDTSKEAYLRTQAVSRLMLDNISHIQSSWVTMGPEVGEEALYFGANDFGSVMFEENVVSAAGTTFQIQVEEIENRIRRAGFIPARRGPLYQPILEKTVAFG